MQAVRARGREQSSPSPSHPKLGVDSILPAHEAPAAIERPFFIGRPANDIVRFTSDGMKLIGVVFEWPDGTRTSWFFDIEEDLPEHET